MGRKGFSSGSTYTARHNVALAEEAVREAAAVFAARNDFGYFCERMQPGFQRPPHIQKIIECLGAVLRGDIDKLAIYLPPRHGKTLTVSRLFPAFALGNRPDAQIIMGSYALSLAEGNSDEVRNYVKDDKWPWRDEVTVSLSTAAKSLWKTNQGGVILARGAEGGITGFGADYLLLDDLIADYEEAQSATQRESKWKWYTDVARSRLMPSGKQIIINTRWHDDDVSGRIQNSPEAKEWTFLVLPALALEDDPIGRKPGQALWPEWKDEKWFASERVVTGERSFSAIYQQNPIPEGGGTFKEEWFTRRFDPQTTKGFVHKIQSCDSAWKTGAANDYSVIFDMGTDGKDIFILDMWRSKVEYPMLKRTLVNRYYDKRPLGIYVEETAAGIPLVAELRTTGIPIIGVKVGTQKKETRAEAVTPLCEAMKIVLPEGAPWIPTFLGEMLRFPGGTHDDIVDAFVIGVQKLGRAVLGRPRMNLDGWMGR